MRESFRVAICLLRVPRLFATLILFPLLLSVVIVFTQHLITQSMLRSIKRDLTPTTERVSEIQEKNPLRLLLYGSSSPLPPPKICRWTSKELRDGSLLEIPPGRECSIDPMHIAFHVNNPSSFDPSQFLTVLNGWVNTVHICRASCHTQTIITVDDEKRTRTEITSAWAYGILQSARQAAAANNYVLESLRELDRMREMFGDRYVQINGMREPINARNVMYVFAIITNVAVLIVIAIWLALKAHRKVLEYFMLSGSLLPLIAATGAKTFYGSLWILTSMRVLAFLSSAAPVALVGVINGFSTQAGPILNHINPSEVVIWLITTTVSLALGALVASISDLKHRYNILSFIYRFIPLTLCMTGMTIWIFTFFSDGALASATRGVISALPLFGTGPMLLAPIMKPNFNIYVIHAVLSVLALVIVSRKNSRWFAAHIEGGQ